MRSLAQGRTACRRSSHSKREFAVVPVDHLLSPAKRLQAAPSSATNASLQPTHELLEQIETILRPGASFGVVLHAERIFARDRDAAVRSVEHDLVSFDHADRQRRAGAPATVGAE